MNFIYPRQIFICILFSLGLYQSVSSQSSNSFSNAIHDCQRIEADALQNITEFVEDEIEKDQIVGAELLILKSGSIILHKAFGWNDKENSTLMKINTIFNIRSMTKTFTGAAIQILIDDGKLKLDDVAAAYLPGFNNQKAREITIEQLLTHRSGLPLSILKNFSEYNSLFDLANAAGEIGPQIAPGTKFLYSDTGVDVLGAILEVILKMPLHKLFNELLFIPLKMYDTFTISKKNDLRKNVVASSYGGSSGNWTKFWDSQAEPFYPFTMGSQSIFSSPRDYAKFLQMLMNSGSYNGQPILSTSATNRILQPVDEFVLPNTEVKYTTGFPDYKVFHGQMSMLFVNNENISHNKHNILGYGGSDGTFAWAWPEKDLIVLYFTQSRNFSRINPFMEFEKIIYRNIVDTTWIETRESIPDEYQQYVGQYIANQGDFKDLEIKILVQNDKLAIDIPGTGVLNLNAPNEKQQWTLEVSNQISVKFKKTETGKIKEMLLFNRTPFQKIAGKSEKDIENKKYQKYFGTYCLAQLNKNIEVISKNDNLALKLPDNNIIMLNKPDQNSRWWFKDSKSKYINFVAAETGKIESMTLTKIERLIKQEH